MPFAAHAHHWLGGHALLLLVLFLAAGNVTAIAKDPKNNFCRRFSHQSAVVGDRLYIDGGYINYDDFATNKDNNSNIGLGYHDLSSITADGFPDFNTDVSKNISIPTVEGGILWPDDVNNRFYLYGGNWIASNSEPFSLLSYDTKKNTWDNVDLSKPSASPNVSAYGAGVGVSETGIGYYYGGWFSNKTVPTGPSVPTMISDFYSFTYDTKRFESLRGPDAVPRAEGGMVWIPAGDAGLLVYMGGVLSGQDNDTSPQPLDNIFIYDPAGTGWYTQTATGEIPSNRSRFCLDVAWAPDKSSYNIYLFGGLALSPDDSNVRSYSDVYILTLPSFVWVKIQPSGTKGRFGSSCNMLKHMSQLLIVGGYYTNSSFTDCDSPKTWGAHNLWTGTADNMGDNKTWWASYNKDVNSNVVPLAVYNITGGTKDGDADIKQPKGGFGSDPLATLFQRQMPNSKRKPEHDGSSYKLGTGAIVGIAIGGAVALALSVFASYYLGKKFFRRREERRQAEVMQQAQQIHQAYQAQQSHQSYFGGSSVGAHSVVTPQFPAAQWETGHYHGATDLHSSMAPLTELPVDNSNSIKENAPSVSPVSPHRH